MNTQIQMKDCLAQSTIDARKNSVFCDMLCYCLSGLWSQYCAYS